MSLLEVTPLFKTRLIGWITFVCSAIGGLYIARVQRFDHYPEDLDFLFPGLIFLVLLPVGALLAFGPHKQKTGSEDQPATHNSTFTKLAALAWTYVALIDYIGFPIATIAFQSAVLAFVFKKRSISWLVVTPLTATIAFTLFFKVGLSVPLPRGVGLFYTLNALII
ncbi:MAG: tripartite tricarboxylate transporter TctB family protein [Pseudomonadota bacterium]